ncbi:glycoside hydrolase family 3 N-terminal domain-containing protein [Rhodococcus sp. HNM0569]|uniref:glycoside hydrolase family 3 N-terminal domain-containing protein n=1 Tax=Rhodococcus sp. HNM0569 TaxID=2716340 RepID=UPI00146B9B39|nr:glycoside hydrolase family 3 N-terminal domain-containing protein [Rhodococcus sp. HNM0569]NLU83692.1 glycoside hydrolase family 3 protein [Rhodococcus sp. HNM0569]
MRFKYALALSACAGLLAGCSAGGAQTPDPQPSSDAPPSRTGDAATSAAAPEQCGADLLSSLTRRQQLAQMLTVGVTDTDDAVSVVRDEGVGGVFVGSWTDESMLANREVPRVQAASELPVMVTIDEEGGRVSRVEDLLGADPSAREAARTMSADEVYEMALERGRGLASLGITVDFAPDVDVSAQPDDAVIGDRSFSDDPALVTHYAGAYAQGLRDAGIFPVIKHFPGHGSGSGDSHRGSVTTPPIDELVEKDLLPFRELAHTGVGVMVGHLEVPGLTEPGTPASISPSAMSLLRNGSGYGADPYDGIVFTDDLSGMQAITDRYDITEAVSAALEAGADSALWLTTEDVPRVLDHLEAEMDSGRLSQQRVTDAVTSIARTKGLLSC